MYVAPAVSDRIGEGLTSPDRAICTLYCSAASPAGTIPCAWQALADRCRPDSTVSGPGLVRAHATRERPDQRNPRGPMSQWHMGDRVKPALPHTGSTVVFSSGCEPGRLSTASPAGARMAQPPKSRITTDITETQSPAMSSASRAAAACCVKAARATAATTTNRTLRSFGRGRGLAGTKPAYQRARPGANASLAIEEASCGRTFNAASDARSAASIGVCGSAPRKATSFVLSSCTSCFQR